MRCHMYASQPQYVDHLAPIFNALPDEMRGEWWGVRACPWGPAAPRSKPPADDVVLIAGNADAHRWPGYRRLVHVDHGAGQTYIGTELYGSYAGGPGLDDVALFLSTRPEISDRWRASYPDTPCVPIGCPKLDQYAAGIDYSPKRVETVAFTWHWSSSIVPEMNWAWPEYRRSLATVASILGEAGIAVIGHAHPKTRGQILRTYAAMGIEPVDELADVLTGADVLFADSTSAAYEFASVSGPAISLNASYWRRNVNHGLRFWDLVPGAEYSRNGCGIEDFSELIHFARGLAAAPVLAGSDRELIAGRVYGGVDGGASALAVAAIRNHLT